MPSILSNLFDKPDAAPDMPTLDINSILQQGQAFNQSNLANYQQNAPQSAQFMQNLYSQLSPQVQQAQNTNFGLGTQLATQGYSNAQSNALNYFRQQGMQTAAQTGAPVTSQFAENLGNNIGVNQVLQNQLRGSQLLGQTNQFQNQLTNQFEAPANSALQANMINPTSLFAPSEYNNQIQGENADINFANSQSQSWFNSLATKTLGSVVAMPFNFVQNGASVVGDAPSLFASMFAGSGAEQGMASGYNGAYNTPTQQAGGSSGGGGGGGGGGGLLSGLMGGGGAGGPAMCCFIFMEAYEGKMPAHVRACRDEFAPENSKRRKGYIRMARWLVPAMRASEAVRQLVWDFMIWPMTQWGGFHKKVRGYENGAKYHFAVKFWFKVWEALG